MKRSIGKILSRFVSPAFLLLFLLTGCTNSKVTVWVASPWQRVLRSTPPDTVKTADLKAAANEYEPFRIIIHNDGTHRVSKVTVTVSDLKGSQGVIKADDMQLYRAHYINITQPSAGTDNPIGWYPDALIPFLPKKAGTNEYSETYMKWLSGTNENSANKILYIASPFVVDPSENAEVWCDLYVPPGTKPGNYSGTASVVSGKQKLADIPVNLKVWGFQLPDTIAMRSNFGRFSQADGEMMGIQYGSKDYTYMESLYDKELLSNRAIPATPSFVWPAWDKDKGITDNGQSALMKELVEKEHFNALDIPYLYISDPVKSRNYLSDMADWLNKLGFLNMSYVQMENEPNSAEAYENVRREAAVIKSANPKISRLCTVSTLPENSSWGNLYGSVDIWAPLWNNWDEKTAGERLSRGEKLWSHTELSNGPAKTPKWEIDMDPLNFRAPLWISWHYNITGMLYWSSVYWDDYGSLNGVWESPHYQNSFWGDGVLLYPGHVAGSEHFVPSIRIKLYREAEEDYEYMNMAAKMGMKKDVDRIVDNIANSFQDWSHNITAYEKAREELANLILSKK